MNPTKHRRIIITPLSQQKESQMLIENCGFMSQPSCCRLVHKCKGSQLFMMNLQAVSSTLVSLCFLKVVESVEELFDRASRLKTRAST